MNFVDLFEMKEEESVTADPPHEEAGSCVETGRIWQGIHKQWWIVCANVKNCSTRFCYLSL